MFRLQFSTSLVAAVTALLLAVAPALAVDPTPAASPVLIDPLDPRSGDNPSLVGAPLLALLVVVALGIAAAVASYAYIRLVARR